VHEDETSTVRDLKAHQGVVLPLVARHGGRIIDTAGDGILAEFPSVVGATECALEIQTVMAARNQTVPEHRRMRFRIGINLGDVVHDDTRIYGDGINIAARLEALADPGGVLVSSTVYEHVHGKLRVSFEDTGDRQLKNIGQPVRVYRLHVPGAASAPTPTRPAATTARRRRIVSGVVVSLVVIAPRRRARMGIPSDPPGRSRRPCPGAAAEGLPA
jgi:adenylate cyclase